MCRTVRPRRSVRRLRLGRLDGPGLCATLWLLSVGRRSSGDNATRRARTTYRVPQPRPQQNLPIVVDGPGAGLVCENSHFHLGLTQSKEPGLVAVTPRYPTASRRRVPSYLNRAACWDASPTVTTLPYIRLGAFSIPQSRLKPKCGGVTIPVNDPVGLHYLGCAMAARTANGIRRTLYNRQGDAERHRTDRAGGISGFGQEEAIFGKRPAAWSRPSSK
jgi:hypothetical protein